MGKSGGSQNVTVIAGALLAALAMLLIVATAAGANTGTLDRDFGNNGRLFTVSDLSGSWWQAKAVSAVGQGGSILVATQRPELSYRPGIGPELEVQLRRYLPNGRIDTSFGNGGLVRVHTAPELGLSLTDLSVDSQGRAVLIGTSYAPPTSYMAPYPLGYVHPSFATVIRYGTDGRLDTSFGGGDGIALFDFDLPAEPPFEKPGVLAMQGGVDPQGRVVVLAAQQGIGAGEGHSAWVTPIKLVARLTPSGDLDPTFGEGGVYSLNGPTAVQSMDIGEAGQLTLALPPTDRDTSRPRAAFFRLTPDGIPDEGFGRDGFRVYVGKIETTQIASDSFRRMLALGETTRPGRSGPGSTSLMRIKPSGVIDPSFGKRGIATVRLPGLSHLSGLVPDRAGGVFLVGTFFLREPPGIAWRKAVREFVVIHLLPSGKPDRHFGRGGRVATRFGKRVSAGAMEGALDFDGHLVVSGFASWPQSPTQSSQALARYELTG
jgi:uncharacterized delta-60 repeat protein